MIRALHDADPQGARFSKAALARLDAHFRGYVDDGRLPFVQLAVTRGGRMAHYAAMGLRDIEAGSPIEDDTLLRIYSMTKPITSVAALVLVERNQLDLGDPVSAYIPAFAAPRVWVGGTVDDPATMPARNTMTVRDLMRHTAGLSAARDGHPVDELYKRRGHIHAGPVGMTLEQAANDWASLPLLYEPGTGWAYSHATDVLGRVIEVASGLSLDTFFQREVFDPLGMADTHFRVPPHKLPRLAALYRHSASGVERFTQIEREVIDRERYLSGGSGLVATMPDFLRFAEMLRRGGELEGARLLEASTVDDMRRNHLPGDVDLASFGRPIFAETPQHGVGFGLGVSVVLDPARFGVSSSVGEYGWGGAASTFFLIDPVEDISAVLMTQLMPSNAHPIRSELRTLLYAALDL